ncbi:carbohydrate-binding module family 20 protein [Xylaria bambusicola]|uniref:carbohydrate-binding module family 20 protein n=1 Tax=Xylaria bambusicola TaxID=326684 RepID=UPI002007FE91|nr:carbohydrate-binding module family 20 protein [Xylaria bambusicola]KAI0514762.1 carbohydrate-binding module family 20 protein [Xylaria bambusicola]
MGVLSAKLITLLSVFAAAGVANGRIISRADGLDSFVQKQRALSLQNVLNNIGPDGSRAPGAGAGVIIASPSTVNPDYFYTWTRDAALTMKMIIDEFLLGEEQLKSYIEDYIHSQAILQTVTNPSGTFLPNGAGIGEPKYNVDLTRFNGAWGRPQRDGPALRAVALIAYSNWLISNGQEERAKTVVWPVISNDLSYVGQYWNSTGFDIWEEVLGSSFFATQNQLRALVEGNTLAKSIGVQCTGCDQAPQVACFLNEAFWNGEYFTANINSDLGRTGKDAHTVIGAISVFDINASCDDASIQPCNSRSLSNFKAFVDSFRNSTLYPINEGIPPTEGIALGRYTEDVYFDGNPWYLITASAAEYLYDALAQWTVQGSLTIDETSLAFFRDIYPAARTQTYTPNDKCSEFPGILAAVTKYAESFVAVFEKYTPEDGSLAEQFNKTSPFNPTSATDLTWSYAAFVSMAERRAGQYPPSWVPVSGSATLPDQCASGSTKGTYTPAIAAGAPDVNVTCTSNVRFEVNATTYFGENILVAGNTTDLGTWDVSNAWPLDASGYTDQRPLWAATIALTAGETTNYVYVRQQDCGQGPIWESSTANRTLVIPPCDPDADPDAVLVVTDDAWQGPTGSSGGC